MVAQSRLGRQPHTIRTSPRYWKPAYIVIGKDFTYPTNIRIRTEGHEGKPGRNTIVSVDYEQRVPFCFRCAGFGHWLQQSRKMENEQSEKWNTYIAKSPITASKQNSYEPMGNYPAKRQNSKPNNRTRRSHRRRHTRKEYKCVLQPNN